MYSELERKLLDPFGHIFNKGVKLVGVNAREGGLKNFQNNTVFPF